GRAMLEATLRTDPSPKTYGWFAIADVSVVEWEGGVAAVHESVWVHGRDEPPRAVRGDRVRLDGQLGVPDDPGFAESLRRRGMAVELRARAFERLGGSSNPFVRVAQACRAVVGRSIRRLFPPREAGLLLGLALGDDSGLDPGVERDFRATGLGHLLVVSGHTGPHGPLSPTSLEGKPAGEATDRNKCTLQGRLAALGPGRGGGRAVVRGDPHQVRARSDLALEIELGSGIQLLEPLGYVTLPDATS
ncbi:MAG: hypothetical protein ACRDFR_06120, partial [Candidatus Limnocylindria bacterium]